MSRGGIIERSDDSGRTYYEVRAECDPGNANPGGAVPFRPSLGGGQWPKQIVIRPESYWWIDSTGGHIFADGTGPGTDRHGGPQMGGLAPSLPKWSLIGRWWTLQNDRYYSDYFFCGGNPTVLDIPLDILVNLQPNGSGFYEPSLHIVYQCNDDAFFDNGGWIHVYQEFRW